MEEMTVDDRYSAGFGARYLSPREPRTSRLHIDPKVNSPVMSRSQMSVALWARRYVDLTNRSDGKRARANPRYALQSFGLSWAATRR
jgi:hypothetical protein